MLKAAGTVEEYEAKADAVKASLRQLLQCFWPACVLTVTAEAGSVILTVVATDTAGGASQVESAAVVLQTKELDAMSSVLGITIEEAPAAPSVIDVQVQVTRFAPSPPPPPPPPPSSPLPPTGGDLVAQDATDPGLATGLALGGCLLVVVLCAAMCFCFRERVQSCMDSIAKSATINYTTKAPRDRLTQLEVVVSEPKAPTNPPPPPPS